MLQFNEVQNVIVFSNVGSLEIQPTRYMGERWEWIAVELACGIADPFPDVGLLVVAAMGVRPAPELDKKSWAIVPADDAPGFRSLASFSSGTWLYMPHWREAFEEVVYHYQPSLEKDEGQFELTPSASVIAFPDRSRVVDLLCSQNGISQSSVDIELQKVQASALFELDWNAGAWNVTPRSADIGQLKKLADPVVSRINASIIEC